VEKQGRLTPELKARILATFDAHELEDLYLPFKQKRKTRAEAAREAGLQALADWVWDCGHGMKAPEEGQTLELWAFTFRNEAAGFPDLAAVLQGARAILTERISETGALRQLVRKRTFDRAFLRTGRGERAKADSKYEKYFDHQEPVKALKRPENSHRYLAARRGVLEKELVWSLTGPPDDPEHLPRMEAAFAEAACTVPGSPGEALLREAASAALREHVLPSIENEVHHALKEAADEAAIEVFARNLRRLLMAAPFGARPVMGVDPGLKTGCKAAIVGEGGAFVAATVLHLLSEEGRSEARRFVEEVLKAGSVKAVAVGNGTGGREAEAFLRGLVKDVGARVPVVQVSEAGASVYSASELAREELPGLDVTLRGAVSIGRRLQDPLAELVKVDPRSIGVGQYQHDVSGRALHRSLEAVLDSCVNEVGVDLNTASRHVLARVSGIGPALAEAIVDRRHSLGLYRSRSELLQIPHFTRKTFEQAAGFLRIPGGVHPLDNTGVHPERYAVLEALAERLGRGLGDLLGPGAELVRAEGGLREELGAFTFEDVARELAQPGRDPREEFQPFQFRDDVYKIEDLKPGMVCPGLVTNVTSFGAFVDVGVHEDGLVHLSRLGERVRDPHQVVHPGQRVEVRVLEVNLAKRQIALFMRKEAPPSRREPPAREAGQGTEARRPAPRPRPAARKARPEKAPAHAVRAFRPEALPTRPLRKPEARRPPAPPRPEALPTRPLRKPEPRRPPGPPPPAHAFRNNPFAVLAELGKSPKR
jgi:uncharacterized protein